MKSIRDFLASKIRRSETEDVLTLVTEGTDDPDLGAFEGTLESAAGRADFYAHGLRLANAAIRYEEIERVVMSPEQDRACTVDVITRSGPVHRINASAAGGLVLHATLRWIGHTRLRRDITPAT